MAVTGAAMVLSTLPADSAGRSFSLPPVRMNTKRAGEQLAEVGAHLQQVEHRPQLVVGDRLVGPLDMRARLAEEHVERGLVERHGGVPFRSFDFEQ